MVPTTCSPSNLSNFFTLVSDMLRYADGLTGLEGVPIEGDGPAEPPAEALGVDEGLPEDVRCPESVTSCARHTEFAEVKANELENM